MQDYRRDELHAMMHDNDSPSQDPGNPGTDFEDGIRFEEDEGQNNADARDMTPKPASESLSCALQTVSDQLAQLSEAFEAKLKYDIHKNKIIDELHDELQEYRGGLVKKHLHSLATDVIKIIDDIRKFKSYYETGGITEQTGIRLLDFLDQIAADLEDLFSWQGITPFICEASHYDSTRQRVVKKIKTDDPAMNKAIAESVRPGYQWDGKLLRPELVAVYVYDHSGKGDMP